MKYLLLILFLFVGFSRLDAQTSSWQGNSAEVLGQSASEINGFSDVRIFPNPVTDKRVNIEAGTHAIQELRITNIAGVVVYAKRFQAPVARYQVVLENVPNGVYLLRIVTETGSTRTSKLMLRN